MARYLTGPFPLQDRNFMQADTAKSASAYLLDVTRSLRRAGRLPTGVDRVELAYMQALLDQSKPVFALARTRLGYLLLDRSGLEGVLLRLQGEVPWGRATGLSWMGRGDLTRRRAESDLRRLAIGRAVPARLPRLLATHLPSGCSYLNVGHSNLTQRVLSTLQRQGVRIIAMVHDLIPLTHPETQRAAQREGFAQMVGRLQQRADLILCNSAATKAEVVTYMSARGSVPACLVAPLGVKLHHAGPQPVVMPAGFDPGLPYVMVLGTIEPRKNHALLLDVWDDLLAKGIALQLVICGSRGWLNQAVFERLDQWRDRGAGVFEMAGLTDGQVAHVMQGAQALLFPSLAEGYGLPALEARALGCPVICSDLPVFREGLGNNAVYLNVNDAYSWTIEMIKVAQDGGSQRGMAETNEPSSLFETAKPPFAPPSWQDHFDIVFSHT
jgi:glycosyltransferase involved in cell wall biosynthesis